MSHLTVTINNNGEIIFSKNILNDIVIIDGVLGNYSFRIPAWKNYRQLTDICKIGTKIFETSGEIYFLKSEHKHIYEDGSLCMVHKFLHKTKGSIKMFIEYILIPYIAGYWNFRYHGYWFNEDNKKSIKNFRYLDEKFLSLKGFELKTSKKELTKSEPLITFIKTTKLKKEDKNKLINKEKMKISHHEYIKSLNKKNVPRKEKNEK